VWIWGEIPKAGGDVGDRVRSSKAESHASWLLSSRLDAKLPEWDKPGEKEGAKKERLALRKGRGGPLKAARKKKLEEKRR